MVLPKYFYFWLIMSFTFVYLIGYDFLLSRSPILGTSCRLHVSVSVSLWFFALIFFNCSSAYCEDVPFFCRLCHLHMCVSVLLSFYAVKISHLSPAYCQDSATFGRSCYLHVFVLFCCHSILSRCCIFCQHTAKMVHLSADHEICICEYWSFCLFMLSRCHILL